MLITCVIWMMIDVVMHGKGRVTWQTKIFLLIKLLSTILFLCRGCCFGDESSTVLVSDYLELYGLNAQNTYRRIHNSYCSRPIHTKMLLSGIFGTVHGRFDTKSFRYKSFRYKSKSIRYTCKIDSIQTHVTSSRSETEYHTRADTNLRCKLKQTHNSANIHIYPNLQRNENTQTRLSFG